MVLTSDTTPRESRPALPDDFAQRFGAQFNELAAASGDPREFSLQWGTRAKPSNLQAGLTIDDVNVGIYGHIPDHAEARNRIPRGAIALKGVTDVGGYSVCDAHRLWSDQAGQLYEEAIQARWQTATDLPWDTGHDVPEDVELAVCQVATELCQQSQTEFEVISKWFRELNPVFHEVKLHLSCNVLDAARMFDGYYKRAMLNGGGLLMESPGYLNRIIQECYSGWTETSTLLHLVRGSFTHTVLRYLAAYGPSQLDRELAGRCLADKTRHIAYAMDHLRFSFSKTPERARAYAIGLVAAEAQVARDEADHVLWEALAVIFGGGVRGMDDGMQIVKRLRRDWVNDYLDRLAWAGVMRRDAVLPALKQWIEEPQTEKAAS
jgi:hypothetical protein